MEKSDFEKLLDFCNENAFDDAEIETISARTLGDGQNNPTLPISVARKKSAEFITLLAAARNDLAVFDQMRMDFEIIRRVHRKLDKDSPVTSIVAMLHRVEAEVDKPQIFVAECKFSNGEIEPAFVVASLRGLAQTSMREIFE